MDIIEYRATFASNLKRILNEKGMSQRELSRRIGVSTGNVTDWMKLKAAPRINVLDKICAELGVKRSDLMSEFVKYDETLTSDEKNLITFYRMLGDREKEILTAMAVQMSQPRD